MCEDRQMRNGFGFPNLGLAESRVKVAFAMSAPIPARRSTPGAASTSPPRVTQSGGRYLVDGRPFDGTLMERDATDADWLCALDAALAENDPRQIEARRVFAAANTWDRRADTLADFLAGLL